ncbi:MAG: hypothetical protein IJQ02_04325 [Oscillospiraceae bacterium]|nr:hypothetical protein [Oscillospiraceae bacterium]
MSRDWTPEELQAASDAMERAGQMGYKEFTAEVEAIDKIVRFARRQRDFRFPCPRCGCWAMDKDPIRNALSRRAKVYICNRCGTEEALEDFTGRRKPLSSWDIAQKENWPL